MARCASLGLRAQSAVPEWSSEGRRRLCRRDVAVDHQLVALSTALDTLAAVKYAGGITVLTRRMANFGKEGKPEPIIAKISQETLAEMIGTTRSRVSFFMNKFRKLGLIDYNGGIHVHSSLLNVVLHEQPEIKV